MSADLNFKITYRNFKQSDALNEAIKKRFTSILKKFYNRDLIVNVVLKKTSLAFMEVSIHLPNFTLVASAEDKDFYTVLDKLKAIVREQLRRNKEKLHAH